MTTFRHNLSELSFNKTNYMSEWLSVDFTKKPQCEDRCICSRHIKNIFEVINIVNANLVQMGSACIKKMNEEQGGNLATTKKQIEKTVKQAIEDGSFDPGRFTQILDLPQYAKDVLAQHVRRKLVNELHVPGIKSRDSSKLLDTALSNGKLNIYIYDEDTNDRTVYLSRPYKNEEWVLHDYDEKFGICYTPKNVLELSTAILTDILRTDPYALLTKLNVKTNWYPEGDSILRYYNMEYWKDYEGNIYLSMGSDCSSSDEPSELGNEMEKLEMTDEYGYLFEDNELLQLLSHKDYDICLEFYYRRKNGILQKGHPWQVLEYERHEHDKEIEIWRYENNGPEDAFFTHSDEAKFWDMYLVEEF